MGMNRRKIIGKRKEKGYTQAEIAKLLGISEAAYRLKEQSKREFTETEMQKLAQSLGVSILYFFAE